MAAYDYITTMIEKTISFAPKEDGDTFVGIFDYA
jgi:hypothetical protein